MSRFCYRVRRKLTRDGFWSSLHDVIDISFRHTLQLLLDRHVRWDRFGWLEALAYGWRIDVWFRHSHVGREIHTLAAGLPRVSVLDVGGAGAGIAEVLDPERFRITCIDLRPQKTSGSRAAFVAGDGCRMPFRDQSFDVVVSVDSLEHVPGEGKRDYLREMGRLARRGIVVHCPAVSADGRFRGGSLDQEFLRRHLDRFGRDEPFTSEHLESGLPDVELIQQIYPGAQLRGTESGPVWLDYMIRERRPGLKYLTGIRYRTHLAQRDGKPPFHSVLASARTGNESPRAAELTTRRAA